MSHTPHATQTTPRAGQSCFVRSYAKINLTLDVLGKRTDGYHELATIMQAIDLYDTLCLTVTDDDKIHLSCSRTDLNTDDNLVVRAAQIIRHHLGISQGLHIELRKQVPVAAGLGGGSSNAAAVLVALQRWWNLPLTKDDLHRFAATLGSDVPFFLNGGLALCEGRGERITPIQGELPAELRWLLLLKPAISVSTASVFRNLTKQDYSDGTPSRTLLSTLQGQQAFKPEDLYNSLERGVLAQYPAVVEGRTALLQAGASFVRLSGSGPTLFTAFPHIRAATQAYEQLQVRGYEVYLTRALTSTE